MSIKTPPALWALAFGAFAIGMTEFVPIGLLTLISSEYGVSHTAAGWVVTAYATGVMIGAPITTWASLKIPRRATLAGLMAIFTVGNILSAVAPTFEVLVISRLVSSLTHGLFFGMGAVVAAELVGAARRAQAVAFMFTGLTVANLVGVPLGTWVGNTFGWRATFWVIAAIGLTVTLSIRLLVPRLAPTPGADLAREVRSLANGQVVRAFLMTLLGFGGVFAAITYLAPIMIEGASYTEADMTWILALLGIGMIVGNIVGGKLADQHLHRTLILSLALLALALGAFALWYDTGIIAATLVAIIGAVGFATVPPLQSLVMESASAAPTLSSVVNIGTFNLGNAVAAWLAGTAIASPLGFAGAGVVGAVMAGAALLLAITSKRKATVIAQSTPEFVTA